MDPLGTGDLDTEDEGIDAGLRLLGAGCAAAR